MTIEVLESLWTKIKTYFPTKTQVLTALSDKADADAFSAHTASNSHMSASEKETLDSLSTNISAISGVTPTKINEWDEAYSKEHTHTNKSNLDSITGNVGTMAYENANSFSSATQVNTALGNKADIATTIAGYGITDAKIENGTITLGNETITPLTSYTAPITSVTTSSTDGNISVNGENVAVHGLGSAAYKDEEYFAESGHTHANMVTGSSLTSDNIVLGNGNSAVKDSGVGIETTLSANLDTKIPTSKAIATYVTSQMTSVLTYKGTVTSNNELRVAHKVGDVYVVSTAGSYAGKACEVGDYIICKVSGASSSTVTNSHWDVINGENQVSNSAATLAWDSTVTIATVDGTDITVKLPQNPDTNTWRNVKVNGTQKLGTTTGATSSLDFASGSANGTISVAGTDVSVKGLGGAAYLSTGTTSNTVAAGNHTHAGYVGSATTVTGASGLTGGGALSGNVTIGHATAFTATAQTSPNAAQTPGYGSTFNVPVISYDKYGHITGTTTTTVKIPASDNTNYYISGATISGNSTQIKVSLSGTNTAAKATFTIPAATTGSAGTMSSTDKTALNNLNPLSGKVSTLSAITATSTAINSLTGSVGSMAFQNSTSYSSATQVNTALGEKSDTGHTHTEYASKTAPTYSASTYTSASITSSEPIVYALVKASGNLTNQVCPVSLTDGQQCNVIYMGSTTAATYTVTISTTYTTPTGQAISALTVPQNGYVEINYLNVKGIIFARGV